nr:hypothetical protein GCM10025732_22020 [Glycomyces mayteni]
MLGSGGQADVYQAVRVSAGISSAPLTVKVFRPNPQDTREHQFRSWDKGDAVLMDLHSRNVGSICRRIDAFYGRAPHPSGRPRRATRCPSRSSNTSPATTCASSCRSAWAAWTPRARSARSSRS